MVIHHKMCIVGPRIVETNLPLVKRSPLTAPNVEQATKTGMIQCTGPRYKLPTL